MFCELWCPIRQSSDNLTPPKAGEFTDVIPVKYYGGKFAKEN